MTTDHDLEQRLSDFYATEAPRRAPDHLLRGLLATVDVTPQRSVTIHPEWGSAIRSLRPARVAFVLVAAILLGAIGLVLVGNRRSQPDLDTLTWTPQRYAEDWPAPPRSEPLAGAPNVFLVRGDDTHWDPAEHAWEGLEHVDPVGDAGEGGIPAVDIVRAGGPGAGLQSYSIKLAGGVPLPRTDPTSRWIAYGVVVDTNADGMADERVGVDNMPDGSHRAWSTDLASGRTKWKAGAPYGSVYDDGVSAGSLGLDTWFPSASEDSERVVLRYSGTPGRYYAWASMIEGGRVVAADYAPDVGWLVSPEDPGLPLTGTTWMIEREIPSRSLIVVMWLIFTPDGRILLELCGRGDATVSVTEDTMRVTDVALTSDRCSAEVTEMEAEILSVLSADEISYVLDDGALILRAGQETLRLEGSPDPPPG